MATRPVRSGHVVSRTSKNPNYPARTPVADDQVSWDVDWPEYEPIEFVMKKVLDNSIERKPGGYADPDVPPSMDILKKRGSHEFQALGKPWAFDKPSGRPRNPRGRTGLSNRGALGKWGPNHAGDAIVTRYNPTLPDHPLEFVSIRRRDTGEWAIPGGMVDPSEIAYNAIKREFTEEAADLPATERLRLNALLDDVFAPSNGRVVYRGYVDDPRNTDNAWMETVAMHFHLPERLVESLPLAAGQNEVSEVRWMRISDDNLDYRGLYASHKAIVDMVLHTHPAQRPDPTGAAAPDAPGAFASTSFDEVRHTPPLLPLSPDRGSSSNPQSPRAQTAYTRVTRLTREASVGGLPPIGRYTDSSRPGSAGGLVGGARLPSAGHKKKVGPTRLALGRSAPSGGFGVVSGGVKLHFPEEEAATADSGSLYGAASRRVVSARTALNSRHSGLMRLGDNPMWRAWAAQQPTSDDTPLTCGLTVADLLDCFDINKPQLRVVNTVLETLALAERSGSEVLVERAIREVARKLVIDDALFEANIFENLHSLLPWSSRLPPIRAAMRFVNAYHAGWQHDDSGRIDNAPTVAPADQATLPATALDDLKKLAFVTASPEMLHPPSLQQHTTNLYSSVTVPPSIDPSTAAMPPTAMVTVGPPGSGKSFVVWGHCLSQMHADGLGPPPDSFLQIDPDFWLTNNCHNDNACRPLVNWLNHETFLKAIRLRQHVVFDGTGKTLLNTCGRVIARFRAAGYRVFLCIVLASYDTCLKNIADRKAKTGRDVPVKIVQDTFEFLQSSVEVYLTRHAEIADRVFVYDNDQRERRLVADLHTHGKGLAAARAAAAKYLAPTWKQKGPR